MPAPKSTQASGTTSTTPGKSSDTETGNSNAQTVPASTSDSTRKRPEILVEDAGNWNETASEPNPFQASINALVEAFNNGEKDKSKKVHVKTQEDVNWVRSQVRKAANDVNMGSRTKFVTNGDGFDVYFKVAPMKRRGQTNS